MASGILELAIVTVLAAALGIFARMFRQPVVLAYLAAGIVIGYFGLFNLDDKEIFKTFSDLGIMLLLFLVGMEVNYASLRQVGRASLIIGLGQIAITFVAGFFIARAFQFSSIESLYLAIAFTFSSTIIVVKLLSEKRALSSLYGKLSIGFLLIEDFFAILILIILGSIGKGEAVSFASLGFATLKGAALFFVIVLVARKVFPFLFDRIARSEELLFLTALAWVFALAAVVSKIGFSIEIAGFLAGVALANSSEHFQIAARIKPLRDFFILIFFVILGSSLVFSQFSGLTLPLIVFSLFIMVGNPLVILFLMGLMGYRKRTSFMTGLTTAQISEFSLIVVALGFSLGHLTEGIVALVTAVGIVTITLSTYAIVYADKLYAALSSLLSVFERKVTRQEEVPDDRFEKPIVLVGFHRTGQSIALSLVKDDLLIVDFDPEIAKTLYARGFAYLFGDIADSEIFEKANLRGARLVISTSPDFEDSMTILEGLGKAKHESVKDPKVVVRASTYKDAELLYKNGADYVMLPAVTAGHYLGKSIASDPEMKILEELKRRDITILEQERSNLLKKELL